MAQIAVLEQFGLFRIVLHQGGFLSATSKGVYMLPTTQKLTYFLYVRKSTDVEDKQVLSVAAQITELKEFAMRMGIYIVDVIIEKETAKKPGRKKFNKMLERIEAGEANGILAWMPDRLSRNSIDSGKIIYMLDQNLLLDLKFPHFWFENTPQGKYMLANEFNASKQYVDNLSLNTKRGLRQMVRDGRYPRGAPLGYYNDMRSKTIKIDRKTAPIVRQAFELYARGDKRLDEIADFLFTHGIHTKKGMVRGKKTTGNKPHSRTRVARMLANPFYYGHFRYLGEVHEGKHKGIISKQLFDQVQTVLERRGKTARKINEPLPLCGLVHCSCGMMFTAETRIKRQKNGNVHVYVYYRCTRKSKTVVCREPHIRAEELDRQLSALLLCYAMPASWAGKLRELIDKDEASEKANFTHRVVGDKEAVARLSEKMQRLLDSYLDGDVERELYQDKRAEILGKKKLLEEQIEQTTLGVSAWVEPMKQWIETVVSICKIAKGDDLNAKKSLCLEIFGSNLQIRQKEVVINDDQFLNSHVPRARNFTVGNQLPPEDSLANCHRQFSPQKNRWSALRAASEKAARSGDRFRFSSDLVRFYAQVRTSFETKSQII